MYARNMTLHIARTHARTLIPQILALMAAGRLQTMHPDAVTTTVASLDDAPSNLHAPPPAVPPKTILTV